MNEMQGESIEYYNRYSRRMEREKVYGAKFLRWTYGNPVGRLALHLLVKRAIFSQWYGWRMDAPASRSKVDPFIRDFGVNTSEFLDPPSRYRTFNEFFYRRLRPDARPVDPDPDVAVFPADGRHLGFPVVGRMTGILVKGQVFDLAALVQDRALAARYRDGTLILSRLCPVDYHRFHFPVGGVADAPQIMPGHLYSVNPLALRRNIHIFTENKRALSRIRSPRFGEVLMLEVGATCVGRFEYTFTPGQPFEKGAEKGFFKFGGSSTITLFEPGRLQLDEDLLEQSARGIELYARVGDRMGSAPGA